MIASHRQRYGAALREWRTARGMSLVAMSAWLRARDPSGPSRQAIAQWELGYREPSRRSMAVLARAGFVPPARKQPPVCGLRSYA
jgi:transcriptional regulator with XRE-family HTH domain